MFFHCFRIELFQAENLHCIPTNDKKKFYDYFAFIRINNFVNLCCSVFECRFKSSQRRTFVIWWYWNQMGLNDDSALNCYWEWREWFCSCVCVFFFKSLSLTFLWKMVSQKKRLIWYRCGEKRTRSNVAEKKCKWNSKSGLFCWIWQHAVEHIKCNQISTQKLNISLRARIVYVIFVCSVFPRHLFFLLSISVGWWFNSSSFWSLHWKIGAKFHCRR